MTLNILYRIFVDGKRLFSPVFLMPVYMATAYFCNIVLYGLNLLRISDISFSFIYFCLPSYI